MKFSFVCQNIILALSLALLLAGESSAPVNQESRRHSCTIGVASGSATEDGRPLLWKTRDWIENRHTRVYYDTTGRYKVLKVTVMGEDWPVMGVNENGFAMSFSLAEDLREGIGLSSTYLMTIGLASCATVEDFEQLLDSTNGTGRSTQDNFAAIDSTGAAKIFEIAGAEYWTYDANSNRDAPNGFIVRANFSPQHGSNAQIGIERYLRSNVVCEAFTSGDSLNYKNLMRYHMRDFARPNGTPLAIPYPDTTLYYPHVPVGGYPCGHTIANFMSQATGVIQGVMPDESPALSTMWTILGMPATSIAIPYWPVGTPPVQADGLEEDRLPYWAREIRSEVLHLFPVWIEGVQLQYIDTYDLRDGNGGGIWPIIFQAEDSFFSITDSLMSVWRESGVDSSAMLALSSSLAETGVEVLQDAYDYLTSNEVMPENQIAPQGYYLAQIFPNPFNSQATISYSLPSPGFYTIEVVDIQGRLVARLSEGWKEAGSYREVWDGGTVGSGLYNIVIDYNGIRDSLPLVQIK